MKRELTATQKEMIKQYEFMKAHVDKMTDRELWWFGILVEEANFEDHYNLCLSSKQLGTWNGIHFDLQSRVHGPINFDWLDPEIFERTGKIRNKK